MQIIYIFMNDFLLFFCIFMNDFGVNRHTFMNDFGVLFHQNARIFLVIPLCQRSPFVALRRCMCHRHVVNVIYVVCRFATLVVIVMLVCYTRRYSAEKWTDGMLLIYSIVFFPPPKGYRTLAEEGECFVCSVIFLQPIYLFFYHLCEPRRPFSLKRLCMI